ncbi:lytic polysaccharide monooxygenase [Plantactinospora siamensis]|uniref:Lytic polysaccharide monooxygenase n=1 Tax=Plantactinospora siamensis TaxID=555372 RepID=A0ABV6P2C8_9ACTN
MRVRILLPLAVVGGLLGGLAVATPAAAHGYVSAPPSRQALCAQGRVANCGPIQYEPQSVEGPKGLTSCSGGNASFAILDDESVGWPATPVPAGTVTFTWVFTARHATRDWTYLIGGAPVAVVDGGGRQPEASVTHSLNLAGRTGRQKILAVWNIADTGNAFYSCIDVDLGGTGGPGPSPSPTPTPSATPTGAPTPTASPTPTGAPTPSPTVSTPPTIPPGVPAWAAGTAYRIGDVVGYAGRSYRCRQAHTALAGWEPPNTPALWSPL